MCVRRICSATFGRGCRFCRHISLLRAVIWTITLVTFTALVYSVYRLQNNPQPVKKRSRLSGGRSDRESMLPFPALDAKARREQYGIKVYTDPTSINEQTRYESHGEQKFNNEMPDMYEIAKRRVSQFNSGSQGSRHLRDRYGVLHREILAPPDYGVDIDHFRDQEVEISEEMRNELWPKQNLVKSKTYADSFGFAPRQSGNILQSQKLNEINADDSNSQKTNRIYLDALGMMGKQMFQYASFYGIARDSGKEPFLTERSALRGVFDNITVGRGYDPQTRIYIEDGAGIYTKTLIRYKWGDMAVCCYLQSWRYSKPYWRDLRQQFKFKPDIMTPAVIKFNTSVETFAKSLPLRLNQTSVGSDTKPASVFLHPAGATTNPSVTIGNTQYSFTYIGVHVRRAGLNNTRQYKQGFRAAPLQYITNAMQYYRGRHKNALFIVVSDSPEWCRINIKDSHGDVIFMGSNTPTVDMAILSLCQHSVMTGGAFGWWSAWLAGGDVVYYDGWMKKGSDAELAYKNTDYYLPWWKAMAGGEKEEDKETNDVV